MEASFTVSQDSDPGIYENSPRSLSVWIKTRSSVEILSDGGSMKMGKMGWGITSYNGMGGFMNLNIHGAEQTGKHYQVFDGKWRHIAISMSPTGESSFNLEMYLDGEKKLNSCPKLIATITVLTRSLQIWLWEGAASWVG